MNENKVNLTLKNAIYEYRNNVGSVGCYYPVDEQSSYIDSNCQGESTCVECIDGYFYGYPSSQTQESIFFEKFSKTLVDGVIAQSILKIDERKFILQQYGHDDYAIYDEINDCSVRGTYKDVMEELKSIVQY